MPASFAETAQKLKSLRDKLNSNTYIAVFGRTVEERQSATAEATALAKQMDTVLTDALVVASEITDLARTTSHSGLLSTVEKYLKVFEEPPGSKMQAGSGGSAPGCTGMPVARL